MDKKVFNIGVELDADFVDALNELLHERFPENIGTKLAQLNGFAPEQLGYTSFIDKYLANDTVADASIDGNSNVHHHDVVTLEHEMIKPHEKLLSFNKIFFEIKKKFGVAAAQCWLCDEWIGRMYMHDGYNASLKQYCFAFDVDAVARKGLFFLENYNAEPPKHFTTFNQMVVETVSYLSNRQSGAVGLPSYLIWAWWFWWVDCQNGYYIREPGYYRDQCLQEIIYRLNQPFLRNSIESAFTNFSIFDRPYFEAFFGDLVFPDGTLAIDHEDDIIQFEKDFMELEAKIRSANMMTYPVLSFSLQRVGGKFVDEEFARWACEFNMLWNDSNFLVTEEITSAASCCFSADTMVDVLEENELRNLRHYGFKELYEKVGEEAVVKTFNGENWVEAKVIRMPTGPHIMYKVTLEDGKCFVATDNHLCVTHRGDVRTDKLVHQDSIKTKGTYYPVYKAIVSIEEIEYNEPYVYCFEMLDQNNPYFMLANGIITHNCRLVSDVTNVDKDVPLGVCNSIGGTSLNVGSVKVNTINLARLAYESVDTDRFLNFVYYQTWAACQALDAQRNIIKRNIEKGLLPNFSSGLIHMERMFSTVGIIGLYEACEHFGLITKDQFGYVHYTDEAKKLGSKVFDIMHRTQDAFKRQYGCDYQFNIEQIPAERAAVVLKEKDQLFHPNEKYTLPAYGNQFVPLGIKTTMQERVEVDGLYDQACNSGCILHFNLDAPLKSADTAWELMNYICDQGVTYFAFVTRISACKENHGFYGDVCPICGGPKETEYTKIVGFLTPVKSWSKERKAEFKLRDWMDLNSMEDL